MAEIIKGNFSKHKNKVNIDLLRMVFERDDYNCDDIVYFDKLTGNIEWLDYGDGSFESYEVLESKKKQYESDNKRYIFIPAITHGEWHHVFQEWLKSIGKIGSYTKSIGLTLKELEEEKEYIRYEWEEYRFNYAIESAKQFLEQLQQA